MIPSVIESSARLAAGLLRAPLARAVDHSNTKVGALAWRYVFWWVASLIAATALISMRAAHPPTPSLIAGPLEDKLSFYELHKAGFNLILLGDSLTYTGLHPEFIDPELGTRSINMATFAHWFPTQYPYIQDLIPMIPRGTRVLWSVHLYDFQDDISVQHVYPVGLVNAVRYWSWGARNPGLADDVLSYNPLTRFFFERDEIRSRLISRGQTPVAVPHFFTPVLAAPEFPAPPDFNMEHWPDTPGLQSRLAEYYSRLSYVGGVVPVSDEGRINSVVLYLKRGGYFRIELAPEYFQEKQREMAGKFSPNKIGPLSVKMFEAGLEAFRQAGIPVTVNVMEEAPFTFPSEAVREKYRRLLDHTLQPIVRGFGDDYVHADYASIVDDDYFDYNHFNSKGIEKYTPLLVTALKKTPAFAHSHER